MRTIAFSILLCILLSCAHQSEIVPASEKSAIEIQTECEKIFPRKDRQLFHRIQARLPNGKIETLLGITQLFIKRQKFNCVLMTVEGLVLFNASFNGAISVQRAVPPFDKKGFAKGILADIRLIFFRPEYLQKTVGINITGEKVCRYEFSNGDIEEIILLPDGRRKIHLFNRIKQLRRSVIYQPKRNADNLVKQIELKAHGLPGYRLNVALLTAVALN